MAHTEDLNTARKRLFEKLGENTKMYCQIMKQWFSMKITKKDFDAKVRKMMNAEQARLHNEFLLCLFNKCNFPSSESVRARLNNKRAKLSKQKRPGEKGAFQPVDTVNYLPQLEMPPPYMDECTQPYCAQEYILPDLAFIKGRFKLGAWELGMEDAEDAAAEMLVVAVQFFLKNILMAIFTQRNGYKLRNQRIIHSIGCPVSNPWLRNTIHPRDNYDGLANAIDVEDDGYREPLSASEIEQREVYQLACATTAFDPPAKGPVSPYDLLQALIVHKSTIPAHSIYAVNMEKIICSLNHPSWEEMEASREFKT